MRPEFRQRVAVAARLSSASEKISAIKLAVTNEVEAADPSVEVTYTDYFNHSFVPDMVLAWPRENRERPLFVRPSADIDWLMGGMRLVSSHHPLVFTLEDLPGFAALPHDEIRTDSSFSQLAQTAAQTNTWITDPSGIAAMSAARSREPGLGLLSQALVRGGRGVLGGENVTALTRTTSAGFSGANQLLKPSTRLAINAAEVSLNEEQSGRMTRIFRALWEAHGGASSDFPTTRVVGRLTDDDLSYLIAAAGDASPEFWRSIGRTLTTEQLGRLHVDDPSSSLQALINASLDNLTAKAVRIIDDPFRIDESQEVPRWLISRGCLGLRGFNWTAFVAGRLAEELPAPSEALPPDLTALQARAQQSVAAITQVVFGRGNRAVTYESKDGGDVLSDPELHQVASDVNISTVDKAVAIVKGGGSINVDFPQKTAVAPTRATIPLGTLLRSALPLMLDVEETELQETLTSIQEAFHQDELFPASRLDKPIAEERRSLPTDQNDIGDN